MEGDAVWLDPLSGERDEMAELQLVIEGAPDFAHRVAGLPPGPADAQSTFSVLPEGLSYDDKFVFGVREGDEMVGCVDLLRSYPVETTVLLGLLLISEKHQRRGLGRRSYGLVEAEVRSWVTCDRVRLSVVRTNDFVLPFFTALGFEATGEVTPFEYADLKSERVVLEKLLGDGSESSGSS